MMDDQALACRKMWIAVLFRHIDDAMWNGKEFWSDGTRNPMAGWRDDADRWLRGDSKGFRMVCEFAGFDPDFVRSAYIAGRIDREAFRNADKARAA